MSDIRFAAASFIARRKGVPSAQSSADEATQYSDEEVLFHHDFSLGTSGEVYPAGRYKVETAGETHERNGHKARIRTSTMLIVPTASGTRSVQVRASDLEAALDADAQCQQLSAQSDNPDSGRRADSADQTPKSDGIEAQFERLGIERVPADVFVWRGYRYTHASDAIAAATRAKET